MCNLDESRKRKVDIEIKHIEAKNVRQAKKYDVEES